MQRVSQLLPNDSMTKPTTREGKGFPKWTYWWLVRLACEHEWTKAREYSLLYYDICTRCQKLRDTNIENIAVTHYL